MKEHLLSHCTFLLFQICNITILQHQLWLKTSSKSIFICSQKIRNEGYQLDISTVNTYLFHLQNIEQTPNFACSKPDFSIRHFANNQILNNCHLVVSHAIVTRKSYYLDIFVIKYSLNFEKYKNRGRRSELYKGQIFLNAKFYKSFNKATKHSNAIHLNIQLCDSQKQN